MEEEILFTIDEQNIAHITLNRPQVHNAIDGVMIQKLLDCFRKLQDTPSVRALIIRGNGESFCSGADLSWIECSFQGTPADSYKNARNLATMLHLFDNLPIPTVTYIHGAVMGGGIGLVACSDIVLSDSHAVLSFPEVTLGFAPAIVSPYVLRAIGPQYARRYFLTGEPFKATEAYQAGLVHIIVEDDKVNIEIEKLMTHILEGAPHAIGQAKKLIHKITGEISETARAMTIELIDSLCRSEEGQQGISAFLKKTAPPWRPKKPGDD
jgi:methylglutaconyl-CoA hydratase